MSVVRAGVHSMTNAYMADSVAAATPGGGPRRRGRPNQVANTGTPSSRNSEREILNAGKRTQGQKAPRAEEVWIDKMLDLEDWKMKAKRLDKDASTCKLRKNPKKRSLTLYDHEQPGAA